MMITIARKDGMGYLGIDACRVGTETYRINRYHSLKNTPEGSQVGNPYDSEVVSGRWPANLLIWESCAPLVDQQTGFLHPRGNRNPSRSGGCACVVRVMGEAIFSDHHLRPELRDEGGGSKFFFVVRISADLGAEGC